MPKARKDEHALIPVEQVVPGDSYADFYVETPDLMQENLQMVKNRLLENVVNLRLKLSEVVQDVYILYRRGAELGCERPADTFRVLREWTGFSEKYLRDLVRIMEMLLTHQKKHLLSMVSIGVLRALAYKKDPEAVTTLLYEIDDELGDLSHITEDYVRQYQLVQLSPKPRKLPQGIHISPEKLEEAPWGCEVYKNRRIFWMAAFEEMTIEELDFMEDELKRMFEQVRLWRNRLKQQS